MIRFDLTETILIVTGIPVVHWIPLVIYNRKKTLILSILHRTKIVLIGKLKNITYKRLQNLCCNTFSLTNYHGIIAWWLQPFTYICRQVQRTKIHLSILCIEKLVGYCVFFRGGGYSRVLNHDESRWRRKKFSCLSRHYIVKFYSLFFLTRWCSWCLCLNIRYFD